MLRQTARKWSVGGVVGVCGEFTGAQGEADATVGGRVHDALVRVAVVGPPSRLAVRPLTDDGEAAGSLPCGSHPSAAQVAALDSDAEHPRWVWWSTLGRGPGASGPTYPELLRAGVRIDRVHDIGLTERLLLGHEVRPLDTHPWAALPAEPDPASPDVGAQPSLFDRADEPDAAHPPTDAPPTGAGTPPPSAADALDPLLAVHADQLHRIDAAVTVSPRFRLLVAAESAAALAAAEMTHAGMPWRVDVHDRVLTELLGARPAFGGRPARLQALAERIAAELGAPGLNVDSQPDLLRALRHAGLPVRSTSKWELRRFTHPALAPLHDYKELYRLHVAHGWAWAEQWVHDERFRPQYVPGGVVSGRWATRGGGALQIPRAVRAAVVPDDGWVLIGADAGQLEPRVLAALSGDRRMGEATRAGDLYAALAEQAFGRIEARQDAKIGLLGAMYGGGVGTPELAALKRRFPTAFALVEDAARTGETGGVVRSALGRTCPPPSNRELEWPDEQAGDDHHAGRSADDERAPAAVAAARGRARGRFTRNFVIQASAADWANVLIAILRGRLATIGGPHDGHWHPDRPHLVFFQHDEVLVHSPLAHAESASQAIRDAAAEATRLVLGDVGVPVPMEPKVIGSYAEKG